MNVFILSVMRETTDFYAENYIETVTTDRQYAFMRMKELFEEEKNSFIQEYGDDKNIESYIDEDNADICYSYLSNYCRCVFVITEKQLVVTKKAQYGGF